MRWRAVIAASVALAGACRRVTYVSAGPEINVNPAHATRGVPLERLGARARFVSADLVRYHCERHYDDLRFIERSLIAGQLEAATTRAHLFQRASFDPGMGVWADEVDGLAVAAGAFAASPTLEVAVQREPRVVLACQRCHAAARIDVRFPGAFLPPLRDTAESRVRRHAWAIDHAREALVAGDTEAWRGALEVLAFEPITATFVPDGMRLRWYAQVALAAYRPTPARRAASYGDMLGTCLGCHITSKADPEAVAVLALHRTSAVLGAASAIQVASTRVKKPRVAVKVRGSNPRSGGHPPRPR